ncbi:MAG: PAS domain S-box protein [Bacteroidales bacterium]|nr:PAS domain S-box protein [Bacteroidales bacterium]
MAGKPMVNEEQINFASDGHIAVIETIKTPIFSADGAVTGVLGIAREITERKKAEIELRTAKEKAEENEEKFRTLFEISPIANAIIEKETGLIKEVNPAFESSTGFKRKEIIGQKAGDLKIWSAPERYRLVREWKLNTNLKNLEVKYSTKWNEDRTGLLSVTPAFISGKGYYFAMNLDITERIKAELAVRESEANLNAVVNNRNESIWSIDKDFNFLILNNFFIDSFEKVFQIKLKKGINVKDVLPGDQFMFWKQKYEKSLKGNRITFEFEIPVGKSVVHMRFILTQL